MPGVPILWKSDRKLILASRSEARRHLLANAGIPFEIATAEIDERMVEKAFLSRGGAAQELAGFLARAKAVEVSRRRPGALCVGADQVLSLDGRIFHKAGTIRDVAVQLARLSGRTHRLTSAFAIVKDGRVAYEAEDHADMAMRSLSSAQIDHYLSLVGEAALTSVGGYQLEKFGLHLMEKIQGDYATILGLPILKLLSCLRLEGALAL
jgi:septum formation protein